MCIVVKENGVDRELNLGANAELALEYLKRVSATSKHVFALRLASILRIPETDAHAALRALELHGLAVRVRDIGDQIAERKSAFRLTAKGHAAQVRIPA